MALPMPRPFRHKSGVYYLNVRLPGSLSGKVRGARVALPIDGRPITATLTDKCFVSLRTRDPGVARTRFAPALAALQRQVEALDAGPVELSYKQIVALAGDVYRARVDRDATDSKLGPDFLADRVAAHDQMLADLRQGRRASDDGLDLHGIDPVDEFIVAHAESDHGPCGDPEEVLASDFAERRREHVYGAEIDAALAARALNVGAATRSALLRETARAAEEAARAAVKNMQGDFTPDPMAARFPTFDQPKPRSGTTARVDLGPRVGIAALFVRWREKRGEALAASTIRRYGPAVASLEAHTRGKDVRLLTQDDLWGWAEARVNGGASARTVNRNDLVAIASLLGWAMTRDGKRLRTDNPAKGVKLEEPKSRVLRERTFRAAEVKAILTLARSVVPDLRYPRAAAGRRWVPWICAYSGARVQEVLHLERDGIWDEGDGVGWVMRLPLTKDGVARTVPIHEHLVAEGLIEYWRTFRTGPLFLFDKAPKAGATRSPQEMRASELAEWIQKQIELEDGVSPNHGWRHTFATNAEAAGIPKRISTAITGHNRKKDSSDGYVTPSLGQLRAAMDRYPRYGV